MSLNPVYTIQPVVRRLYKLFDNRLYTRYSRLSNRLSNGFDNRLNVCKSYTRFDNRFDNRFDKRLYRVNGAFKELTSDRRREKNDVSALSIMVTAYAVSEQIYEERSKSSQLIMGYVGLYIVFCHFST